MCITCRYTHTHTYGNIYIYNTHTHIYMGNNYHTSELATVFDTKRKCSSSQSCLSFLHFFFKFYFWLHHSACGSSFSSHKLNSPPSALEAWSPNHWLSREFSKLSFILKLISLRPQTSHSSKGLAMASTLPRPRAHPWTPQQGLTLSTPPPSSDSFLTQAPRLVLFLLHGLCLLSILWERLPFPSSKGGVSFHLYPLLRWVKSHGSNGLNDINTLRVPNMISAINTLMSLVQNWRVPYCCVSHPTSNPRAIPMAALSEHIPNPTTSQHRHCFPPSPSHHRTWRSQQLPNLSFCCYHPIFFSSPIHTQQPEFLKMPLS